jgi:Domain of unknown function (DUF4838)/Glycosyl hydrolases family 2, sugar binding domain
MIPSAHLRRMVLTVSVCLFCLLATSACAATSEDATLQIITNGAPRATIVLPSEAHTDETLAAKELKDHLKLMSGATLRIVKKAPASGPTILLGAAAGKDLLPLIRKKGDDPAAFAISVKGQTVRIQGLSPEGTLFGVYELLEQLGCRWYMPSDFGRVVPKKATVAVRAQTTIQVPSFNGRWFTVAPRRDAEGKVWQRRVRMGGPFFPSAHGFRPLKGSRPKMKAMFKAHPEYYALVKGKRVMRQACLSNKDVLRLAIAETKAFFRKNPDKEWMGMGPNDGGGFCECEGCRNLDGGTFDPFSNEPAVTDRYVWFFNQILKGIEGEFPKKKICFYIYHTYMLPPVRHKLDPRICGAFAPITLCRVHGMSNPICPDRSYYVKLMKAWGKVMPDMYERGYCCNLADPGFPFSRVHVLRDEIPKAKKLGIKGWRVESFPHWGSMTPTFYISGKLMWDVDVDVDGLVKDFAKNFFGPAQAPMHRYLVAMDAALRDADHHTGSSFNMPDFYPAKLRAKMRLELDRAAALAKGTPSAKRVAAFRLTFDMLESFITMLDTRNQHDYKAANAAHDKVMALGKKAYEHKPTLVMKRAFVNYMRRFWTAPTVQGWERVTKGNRLVAGLPDVWDFTLDPQEIGEELGYFRPELTGGNWRPMKTSSASWSDQGLNYFRGVVWYRTSVDVPAKFKNKPLRLWFGGVDEVAKVWVNGKVPKLLTVVKNRDVIPGASPGRSFVPFEYDVTGLIRPGEKNTIAVKITNKQLNELGTGGITAPVMIWSPK